MTTRPKRSTRPIAAGVIFVLVIVAVGLAAAGRPNNLLIWVFSFLMGGLLVSGIVSGLMMMPVRAIRIEPRRGRVGEPLLIRYEISNSSRLVPVFDIRVDEALAADARGAPLEPAGHGWILHVGPRERFHAEGVFRPTRRGLVRLDAFDVSTSFPFGLMRKSLRFTQSGDVLIHPEVKPLRPELIANVTAGGFGGQRLSREPGGFDDFFGVREYRPGDSVRTIAWKRLAGTGQLATIERSRSVPPRVRVLLDLRTPTTDIRVTEGEDARALEEQAIVLAASMVALCDRLGYEYALSLAGVEIPPIALRKGHFHREKIMSALAAINLDLARTKGNGLAASDERAVIIAIHPDRADLAVAPSDAWHFTARQLEGLLERTAREGA
ncbi:MAG: hypothetical protein RIT24_1350 [Planctomycetota bacterium]|jgi:uncharacterized protein (DUF58 family)